MCGRLACSLGAEDISSACYYMDKNGKWQKPDWIFSCYDYKPYYNGPPTTVVAVLANKSHFVENNNNSYEACLIPMRWGMLPTFKTETSGNFHTHNARIETIKKSAMYKPCLSNGKRCIVVAEGYYEWQTTQGENNKQPYYVYQEKNPDEEAEIVLKEYNGKHLIKLAGLFNVVKDEENIKYTCTILTKESDKTMAWMHHRMPIILNTQTEIMNWLNHKEHSSDESLNNFLKESEKCKVNYYIVDKQYVNKSSCNDIKCMQRLSVKRKNTLDSWLKPKSK